MGHQVTAGVRPLVEDDWERQVTELWSAIDAHEPAAFLEKMRALVGLRPADDAIALFELASANDSTGHPEDAAPLYRRALSTGLEGIRRRRATERLLTEPLHRAVTRRRSS